MKRKRRLLGARLFGRIEYVDHGYRTQCWDWLGACDAAGYGRITVDGKSCYAHRVAYEALVGPIPENLTIDHRCENRKCVNPEHLVPATHRENILRGNGIAAQNARKTHCRHGHEFTEENTYCPPRGKGRWRQCRTCLRDRTRKYRARKAMRKAATRAPNPGRPKPPPRRQS